MTTVVDPNGTPVPIYNKSGTTIQNIAANGVTQGSGTSISTRSETTVVLVTSSTGGGGNTAVVLPDDGDVGDVVEIYATGAFVDVFPASGHSIGDNAADMQVQVKRTDGANLSGGRSFRRMTATTWQATYG